MATTDRITFPVTRRTITDRLGENVILGSAGESASFDVDATATLTVTSESEVTSAFSMTATAVFVPVASYIEREYDMDAAASLTMTAESFATANFDMDATASLAITTDAEELEMRNTIVNGNFDFWQRGTSLSAGTGDRFLADRFVNRSLNTTHAPSRQSFTIGQTDVPGQPTFFHRSVISTVAGAGNFGMLNQRVEGVRTFAGETATLSFWAKADASKNMAFELIQDFGTGGSPSADVTGTGVTTCALTTSWQKFEIDIAVPSISGKTIGTNLDDFVGLFFWFDAGSSFDARTNTLGQQSGTFDIAQVQFEAGASASPFEKKPLALELESCLRYYEETFAVWGTVTAASMQQQMATFKTKKRATPTVTVYADSTAYAKTGTVANVRNTTAASDISLISSPVAGVDGVALNYVSPAGAANMSATVIGDAEL